LNGLIGAVGFLTRIPVSAAAGEFAPSVKWFPVVGLGIGSVAGVVDWFVSSVAGATVGALAAVATAVAVTGALHEDGLADTFDGLSSIRTRERQLEIMKDSRLGTFGAAALVLVLVSRVTLVTGLGSGAVGVVALAWAHGVSRAAAVAVMVLARTGGEGLGVAFATRLHRMPAASVAVLVAAGGWWVVGGDLGWALLAVAFGPGFIWLWAHRRIGAVTGDVLGACQQLALVGALGAIGA